MVELTDRLGEVLNRYSKSFSEKIYVDEFKESDVLMNAFGVTQDLKSENKQYWGRELGKCWENLIRDLFEAACPDFLPPEKFGADEPADFFVGKDAIDTKYRVGSGDSGTLKKFEQYGKLLATKGYRPVFLFLRTDNLPAALSKMNAGGWTILTDESSFKYIRDKTGFDLKAWLIELEAMGTYKIDRDGN